MGWASKGHNSASKQCLHVGYRRLRTDDTRLDRDSEQDIDMLKYECHSHHQMERPKVILSRSQAQGNSKYCGQSVCCLLVYAKLCGHMLMCS